MHLTPRRPLAAAIVAGLALSLSTASFAAAAEPNPDAAFVQTDGASFSLDGADYHPLGSNNYYPMYSSQAMVDALFTDAQDAGFNTMRVWGFFAIGSPGDGSVPTLADKDKGVYFQYWDDAIGAPAINEGENGLVQLDRVVASAKEHGLRLILPLTNNWSAFGGMDQYLLWARAAGEDVDTHDDFYTNATVKQWYREYVDAILNRTNTITGTVYKDDPTIMTWELGNEPRCVADGGPADGSWGTGLFPRDADCDADTLTPWVDEMSNYIQSIDGNHLVAVGDEGFFNHPGGDHWTNDGGEGVDTEAWTRLDGIDYMSYHLYPDHWGTDAAWGAQWIIDHNESAQAIGKPALLGEFGWLDHATRNTVYQQWLDAQLGSGGAGTLYWILSSATDDGTLYPDYDGFTVYCPSPVCTTIQNFGALVADPSTVLPPVADDDATTVDFGATASLTVTANDIAYQGGTIDPATVDLDVSSGGIQDSVMVSGSTATVDAAGVVTITPADGFSGDLRYTYVVSDSAGRLSNTATITVSVRPPSDSWVTFEDFSAGADRWQCTNGTTVTPTRDGAAMFANDTGDWDWCFFTPTMPLDLSDAAIIRYDLLGSDSGINGEVMLKVAGGTTEGKTAVAPPTWTSPAIGDAAPSVKLSSYSDAVRAHLDDVTQIGFGMQKGHHELANFRYSLGGQEPTDPTYTEVPLSAFADDGAAWSCDRDGATVATDGTVGTFTNGSGDWAWCAWTPSEALDLSDAAQLRLDFVTTDSGVGPEVAFKTGDGWDWGGKLKPSGTTWFNSGDAASTMVFDLTSINDGYRETLGAVQQILIGVHPGTHEFTNLRYAVANETTPESEPNTWTTVEDFNAGQGTWQCDRDEATVTGARGVGTFANASGGWAWCQWTPTAPLDASDALALRLEFLATDSGVGPEIAFKTGDGWDWGGQLKPTGTIWFNPGDAPATLDFDLTTIDGAYRATLGSVRAILVGVHPGTHQFGPISFGTYVEDVEPGTPKIVTPAAPTVADNVVTIPEAEGVTYVDATASRARALGDVLTGSITLTEGQSITIRAVAGDGYAFADDAITQWSFAFQTATDGGNGDGSGTGGGSGSSSGGGGGASAVDGTAASGSLASTGGRAAGIISPLLLVAMLVLSLGLGAARLGRRRA